jgi:hypothetical protein
MDQAEFDDFLRVCGPLLPPQMLADYQQLYNSLYPCILHADQPPNLDALDALLAFSKKHPGPFEQE